jgi:hypothetical protein
MAETANHYLRIHFAPNTACVTIKLSAEEFIEIKSAADKHTGVVTYEISSCQKIGHTP